MSTMVEVLEQHIQIERNKRCVCGWRPDYADSKKPEMFPEYRQHREHVAAMLVEAGFGDTSNMRRLTMVEEAERDRPEGMKAARAKIRGEALASRAEMTRRAQELAWEAGFTRCAHEFIKQREDPTHPITRDNPYQEPTTT